MSIQLSQEIEYKNPVLWFKDMWFQNKTDALASPVKHKVRIFYIEDLPDGVTYTTHWHTYKVVDGSITDVLPLANEVLQLLAENKNEHLQSVNFEDGVLVMTLVNGNTLQVTIDSVGSPVTLIDDWDASTNTPDISGYTEGNAANVIVAGTYDGKTYGVGDWAVKTANAWIKIDNQTLQAAWSNISGKPFDSYDTTIFYVEGGVLKIHTDILLGMIDVPEGTPGASALDIWNNEGHEGDAAAFLEWLSSNAKLTETIVASGVSATMGIPDGEEFLLGTLVTAAFKQLLRRAVHPSYTPPTIELTVGSYTDANKTVEVGTAIVPVLSSVFTPNDAVVQVGDAFESALQSVDYYMNGGVIAAEEDGSYVGSHTLNVVGTVLYNVLASFGDYYTKKNNLGEDDATNKFNDRTVEDYFAIDFKYKHFAVALASAPDAYTASIIRNNNEVNKYAGENYSFGLDGKTSFAIVVPPGYELDTKNTKTNGSIPDPLFDGVVPTTFDSFPCAGTATATYKLYVKTNAVAYSGNPDLQLNVVFTKL